MKKAIARSAIVDDSLKAISNVDSYAALREGLANTMSALLSGEISADDGHAIAKAARKQRVKINREVLKDSSQT